MEPENIDSNKLEDCGIYDKEICVPISGVVVVTYDKEKDIEPNKEEIISMAGTNKNFSSIISRGVAVAFL